MSDHSSHFDSVLGTAINLGIHSVNEKGSLTHPKVSVLAREAKELQGVRSPPSPAPPAAPAAASAPKKEEGTRKENYLAVISAQLTIVTIPKNLTKSLILKLSGPLTL